jgi:tetratricopeptide (TPR) repeat protein
MFPNRLRVPRLKRRFFVSTVVVALLALVSWLLLAFALPRYHLRAARQALSDLHADLAQPHLAACLKAWPANPEAHLLAARAARLQGDSTTADEHLRQCEHQDWSPDVALERAMLRAQNGDLDKIEDYLRYQVEQDHPDTVLILDALVRGYIRVYRFNLAQLCLKRWLERQPDSTAALLHRARMWEMVHNYQDAAEDFRRVLQVDSASVEAQLGLANSLLELAQPGEALHYLEELQKQHPDDPQILVRLACCQNTLNNPAEAQVLLDKVLASQPDLVPAIQGRAQVALQLGNPEEAEEWARKAIALAPYDYQVNYLFFQCLKQCGKPKEAQEQFAKVERIKANVLRMQELGNRKLQAAPNDPALRCEMGTLCFEFGQDEVGLGWLLSALQKAPDYRPAHAALAQYYERKGDSQRAAQHRQLAAQASPSS